MSLPSWVIPFKEPRTVIKCIKGHYYKYEVTYPYDKRYKRGMRKTGKLLGKVTEHEGFVPSPKNTLRNELNKCRNVDTKTYGVFALFESLLSEEIPSLYETFGKDTAEFLMAFAMMRFAYQSPIKRLEHYVAQDFCSEVWNKNSPIYAKKTSELLKNVGENRCKVVDWMKGLLPPQSDNFILMDSTHVVSDSEHLTTNAVGYNPDRNFNKQIRLMYMFCTQINKPVYFRLVNGNVADVTSMKLCLQEMKVKNVVLVADKGFYSDENVKSLDDEKLCYLIPLRRSNSIIDYAPFNTNDVKVKKQFFIYQKRIIWFNSYEKDGRQYVTFLDEQLKVEEQRDFLQREGSDLDKYSGEQLLERMQPFGTLTLVHRTNTYQTPEELYEIYKQRNEIEVMFDSYKNFLEADRSYMQNRYVLDGWLFVNFIAMLAYYKLYDRLRKAMLLSKTSPKDVIEFSKSIYQHRISGSNEWKRSEFSTKHKQMFKKLGVAGLT
jgi:transposase